MSSLMLYLFYYDDADKRQDQHHRPVEEKKSGSSALPRKRNDEEGDGTNFFPNKMARTERLLRPLRPPGEKNGQEEEKTSAWKTAQ